MPKKLALFVVETDRQALGDGRVIERSNVKLSEEAQYEWKCICEPGHDHQPIIDKLAAGLSAYNALVPFYQELLGKQYDAGSAAAVLTDCNIQINGPESWSLYVSWDLGGGLRREYTQTQPDPALLSTPAAVEAVISNDVQAQAALVTAAAKVAAFDGEVSDPDPVAATGEVNAVP